MKNRLGLISWATGTLLLAAVSACGDNDADPPPTRQPHRRQRHRAHRRPSASPTSPSDAATAEPPAAVRTTSPSSTSSVSDPSSDLKKLETVAIGAQLNAVQTPRRSTAAIEGQRQTGTTAISELKVQSVNLDNSDPDAGKVPTVVIDVCWDVSKVDVLDKSGKSIVSPDPPGHRVDALHRRELRLRRRSDRRLARGDGPGPQADAMRGILIRLLLTALAAAGFSVLVHAASYADTVCSQTDPATGECLDLDRGAGHPGYARCSQVTTGRRTPGTARPATGTARAKASRSLRPGRCRAHRPTGYWSNSYHCYISPVEPQPPAGDPSWQGHEPGDGAVYNCYQPQTGLLITVWSQDPPPDSGTGPTPREVAQIAIEQMHLSAINIGIAPEPGPDSIGLVGMPVWMWAKDPNAHTVGPITESASAGGITVTATAAGWRLPPRSPTPSATGSPRRSTRPVTGTSWTRCSPVFSTPAVAPAASAT